MKKIVFALAALAIVSCKKEETKPVDYTLFTGTITNPNSDKLTVLTRKGPVKDINVDENGKFADTLRLDEGQYYINDGNEYAAIYVKKGAHMDMTLDTKEFDKSIKFTGKGAESNNYFSDATRLEIALFDQEDLSDVPSLMKKFQADSKALLDKTTSLDSLTKVQENKKIEQMVAQYGQMLSAKAKLADMKGKPSPAFENYENYKGGTTSLSDLKGKYVYIDAWATWCGPCKKEIPFLKEVEKEFHGKNIEFVSISLDNGRGYKADSKEAAEAAAKEGWKKMIADKEMTGLQLYADKAFQSDFATAYGINSIPRFILIDPNGNIVDADAPRPSSPKLKELFAAQGI
ncbi:TlpA family protein disulfide reductase [Pseudofulvibacter geojedonensis]|uniref:TlpA family protein disulfide reductase n=1 Tax=Pseudofulvibacter geojedonensis TaxID=1123758 RepID=A0ABW3HYN9_9FLAO